MDLNILDYNLFTLKNIGFGCGFIIFSCVNFIFYSTDKTIINNFKPGLEEMLARCIVGVVFALIAALVYIFLKFVGIGLWKVLSILWDHLFIPLLHLIFDIFDEIYSYDN